MSRIRKNAAWLVSVALLIQASALGAQEALDAAGDPLPKHAIARLGTTRWRQSAWIQRLKLSDDGKILAAVSDNEGQVYWDTRTGRRLKRDEIAAANLPRAPLTKGTFNSADGSVKIDVHNEPSAGKLRRVTVWDAAPLKRKFEFLLGPAGKYADATSVALSRDGKTLYAGDDRRIRIWDVPTGKEQRRLEIPGRCLALSADGKVLAASGADKLIIWDLATDAKRRAFPISDSFYGRTTRLMLSADGRIVVAAPGLARAWDTTTGKLLFSSHVSDDQTIDLSADGRSLFFAVRYVPTIRRWDLKANEEVELCPGHQSGVKSLAFLPDGKRLLAGSHDRTARLWQIDNPKAAPRQHPFDAHIADPLSGHTAISPDGKYFALAPDRESVAILETDTGKTLHTFAGVAECCSLAFSRDGQWLAAGDRYGQYTGPQTQGRVFVWNVRTGERRHLFENLEGPVRGVAFSPRGDYLAAAAGDLRVWRLASGGEMYRLPTKKLFGDALFFTPDEKHLICAGQKLMVWDLATRQLVAQLRADDDRFAALSPDGKLLAVGTETGAIRLLDFPGGQERAVLSGHARRILSLAFSRDGTRLASGSDDTTILIWDVAAALGK